MPATSQGAERAETLASVHGRRALYIFALSYGLLLSSLAPSSHGATDSKASADEEPALFSEQQLEFPQPDPALGLLDARTTQSLNGQWRYIVDPMGVGEPGSLFGGYPLNRQVETGMELIEYDFNAADLIRVPGDWNSQSERLFFYQGRVWYYRTFEAMPRTDERLHLSFGGANFDAQIYLNGEPLGEHRGGYVPFSFDVTEAVQPGQNVLLVKVDNRLSQHSVPTARTDWWPYGGLTRDVEIVRTPQAFIRNAKATLIDRQQGQIQVDLSTSGFKPGTRARVKIPELDVDTEFEIGASGAASTVLKAGPTLWTPSSPKLYDVEFVAGADRLTDRIGFRTIETRGPQILLNGEPIRLRGISTHEEPIGKAGVATSRADSVRILKEAQALNANFVRLAHYPYSRHMARAADELGLLLWAEIPVYWNIAWRNPETLAIARNQLRRLIQRDWNRASVIIWSVANETPLSDARMDFLKQLISDARSLDPSRLVSAALLGGGAEEFARVLSHLAALALTKEDIVGADRVRFEAILARAGEHAPQAGNPLQIRIEDPLGAHTDLISYNQYFGWYYSALFAQRTKIGEDVLRPLMLELVANHLTITADVNKPIHISEFGAGAKAGRGRGPAHIWSEAYQAAVYEAQLKMLSRSSQVQGMTPWILKDFRAMLRPLAGVQDYYNRKGLIDERGRRKRAFAVLRDFYAGPWGR